MKNLSRIASATLTASVLATAVLGAGAGSATAATASGAVKVAAVHATTSAHHAHATKHAKSAHRAKTAKHAKTTKHAKTAKHATTAHHATTTHHATAKKVAHKSKAKPAVVTAQLTGFELALLNDMNAARAAAGVPALIAVPGATDVARRWSLQLAQADGLSHNPSLVPQLQSAGSSAWEHIAENVGSGPSGDEADLFAAYMASEHHRDNILDPNMKYVGVGVVQVIESDGTSVEWNTVDFTDEYTSSYGADRTPALSSVLSLAQAAQAF